MFTFVTNSTSHFVRLLLLFFVMLGLPSTSLQQAVNDTSLQQERYNLLSTCRTFLAPSSIPGAGLGMFAGRDFVKNEEVTTGDAVVPILQFEWHNAGRDYHFLWHEYWWSSDDYPSMALVPDREVTVASFGIGALPNCFFPLVNVDERTRSRDNAAIVAGMDPGSGAFTPFHNRQGRAKRNIRAGEEIFVSYGLIYFRTRKRVYGEMPHLDDYKHPDEVFERFQNVNAWIAEDDIEWLHEHGSCMDHLVVQTSTLPHAGRGAFANKFLPKGSLVAPVPLLHIPDRVVMEMNSGYKTENGEYVRNETDVIHQQLLLNYCYGHDESTLLLCPYGVASSLVNHGCSENNCQQNLQTKAANVKAVWSNRSTTRPEWFDLAVDDWARTSKTGLAFDYIALRDIQAGEEVLIDYGKEWVQAWNEHISQWQPKKHQAHEINERLEIIPMYNHEWPYNDDVMLWCYNIYREMRGLPHAPNKAYPCRVVDRTIDHKTDEVRYIAEIIIRSFGSNKKEICAEIWKETLFDLPRDAFVFGGLYEHEIDKRDYEETWSFRHHVQIPDDLMPEIWKNSKKTMKGTVSNT